MLFDLAIQKWVELAKTDIGSVNWTRDGKYLYFDSGSGLDPAISPCAWQIESWSG